MSERLMMIAEQGLQKVLLELGKPGSVNRDFLACSSLGMRMQKERLQGVGCRTLLLHSYTMSLAPLLGSKGGSLREPQLDPTMVGDRDISQFTFHQDSIIKSPVRSFIKSIAIVM